MVLRNSDDLIESVGMAEYKLFFVACCLLLSSAAKSQQIVYDLPVTVTDKIKAYTSKFSDTTQFAIQLSVDSANRYTVYVMEEDNSNSEGARLVNEMLIGQTNRFVRVREKLLPLITSEDFVFAYLGPGGTRKGKVGRKKLIQNFDGYSITFDTSGRIY